MSIYLHLDEYVRKILNFLGEVAYHPLILAGLFCKAVIQ